MIKQWHKLMTCLAAVLVTLMVTSSLHAAGDRLRMLVLKGNIEIAFGAESPLDKELVKKLNDAGFDVTELKDFHPLTMDYLKQFNIVVWIGITPYEAYSRYYGPTGWQGGSHMFTVKKNAELLQQYVKEGGALVLNPSVEEVGMSVVKSHRKALAPYGIDTMCAQLRDKSHEFEHCKVINQFPYYFHWTENITDHPVTKDVKRVYYPGYTMRWDDNVTTLPLYPKDKAWVPLVKGEKESRASWFRGTPYEKGHWKDSDVEETATIAAVRDYGKGRVGIISISNFLLYYYPYGKTKNHAEIFFGPQDGKLMEKGDGKVASDLAKMMIQMYRWLCEPGQKLGFGVDKKIAVLPIPKQPIENMSDVWADRDLLTKGPVKPIKILVGARSNCSDGQGTVAEYAEAAKKAGYGVVAFTETFEATTPEKYSAFVKECQRLSTPELVLLPGLDVEDELGNRFLLLGKEEYLRAHLLVRSEDEKPGKKLIFTGHMLIGMGEILPVAARPERLAKVREKGALPPDLYSHCPGVAVETYKDGKKVDDGLFAYKWQVFNASIPIPVAVHEVYSPQAVATAAKTGLQTIVNSDNAEHAVAYFCQGHMSFGGNPMRYYVSSGPIIDSYKIDSWQNNPWTISLSAQSANKITDVIVNDQRRVYRHFRPDSNKIDVSWSGDLGAQHWFVTEIVDDQKGRAITSPLRTLPSRHFVRCMDRQNWFSTAHFKIGISYTGRQRYQPFDGKNAVQIIPQGVKLEKMACPKMQLNYAGPNFVIVDYKLDSTLQDNKNPGADSYPIFNCLPIKEFESLQRYNLVMPSSRSGHPNLVISEGKIKLKEDLTIPNDEIWPVFKTLKKVKAGKAKKGKKKGPTTAENNDSNLLKYAYYDAKTNNVVEGTLKTDEYKDLPAGALVESNIFLVPIRVNGKGEVGFPSPGKGKIAKAGTVYKFSMTDGTLANVKALANLNQIMKLTQGSIKTAAAVLEFNADNYGVAGTVDGTEIAAKKNSWLHNGVQPVVKVSGVNANWPTGVWQAEKSILQPYGVFEGKELARLFLSGKDDFYVGNLLIADSDQVDLSFASPWSNDSVEVNVHNPTDKEIKTTIQTPAAINKGYKALKKSVTVPAGKTVKVTN